MTSLLKNDILRPLKMAAHIKNRYKGLSLWTIFAGTLVVLALAAGAHLTAQCVDDPSGKTAVKLSNQTKHDLVLGIDDENKGMVPSHKESPEWEVEPGNHLLIAGAIVEGRPYWVWVKNEISKGQICTWTIADPEEGSSYEYAQHRSA